ncbi:hypothetical protein AOLI_G00000820 [Acnodon oligacanthus]
MTSHCIICAASPKDAVMAASMCEIAAWGWGDHYLGDYEEGPIGRNLERNQDSSGRHWIANHYTVLMVFSGKSVKTQACEQENEGEENEEPIPIVKEEERGGRN